MSPEASPVFPQGAPSLTSETPLCPLPCEPGAWGLRWVRSSGLANNCFVCASGTEQPFTVGQLVDDFFVFFLGWNARFCFNGAICFYCGAFPFRSEAVAGSFSPLTLRPLHQFYLSFRHIFLVINEAWILWRPTENFLPKQPSQKNQMSGFTIGNVMWWMTLFFFLICILGLLTSLLKLLLLTAGLVWGWDEQSGGRGRSSLPSWGSSTAHCTPISSWETTGSRRGQVSPLSPLHVACPGPAGSLHFRFRSRPTRRYAYLTVGFQA